MKIDEVLKIGKVAPDDENIVISLIEPIHSWLNSDKFKAEFSNFHSIDNESKNSNKYNSYASLPYPPLVDPDVINYDDSEIGLCWALNIPLPPFYDFIIFGSHGVGLHSGVRGLLRLCGCAVAERANEKDAFMMYADLFEQLKKLKKQKDSGKIKK